MEDDQQFCLRWNNHQSTLISVFDTLLENQTLVDCTLAAEGKFLKAHKVVLSACSPFFATLLQQQYDKHPIFILKDVKYQELRAMMDYMYRGEVNISQDQLAALLKAAESLQIKGLSDNRSGSTPKTDHHRGLNVPGSGSCSKLGGYTLEQTQAKRARAGPSSMEMTDISGSREGSSSPSRRRRKVRRRSVENAMSEVHDSSNSSQIQASQPTLQQQAHQQQQQSNANLSGVGSITAATSSLALQIPVSASSLAAGTSGVLAATGSIVGTQQGATQQLTTNITKKTESVKATGTSDAVSTENVQAVGVAGIGDDQNMEHVQGEKSNHKQKSSTPGGVSKETAELVIEPKSEYEEEGNEEPVEDLTLDDEEMGMEDLDQNAGTSQAGEGSSQGYAPWQHDRSQDELLLATQESQQRDPQAFGSGVFTGTTSHPRHSLCVKTSPLNSPICTAVIKYESTASIDDNVGDAHSGTVSVDVAGDNKITVQGDGEDDEQPCDLRLSSFRMNLVSMALQQAAVAAAANDPAVAAIISGGSVASSTGRQQAALQSIAARASTATPPPHLSSLINFPHAHKHTHHQISTQSPSHPRSITPTRRYSTNTSTGATRVGLGPSNRAPSPLGVAGNISTTLLTIGSNSSITSGPSTSATVSSAPVPGGNGGQEVGTGSGAVSNSGSSSGHITSAASGGASFGGAYTCERCGNSYARPHSLNRHMRFECGVEPKFECPICHKKSKHKHNLVLHMRTHQHR